MSEAYHESKRRLLDKKEELMSVAAVSNDAADTVELDQSRMGRLSRMDAMQAQVISAETERRRQVEVNRINAALKRIDNDEYGYCARCDEDISAARLEADPAAPLCVDCAEKAERR